MAEGYKKISDLTEMLASDINSSTKMVVTTGELKDSRNLNVSDLVVGNLSTDSNYRALSSSMGKKLNDEKAPILNPVFSGTVSGVTKAMVGLSDVDNTSDASKPISSATQIALNSKAPTNSPIFSGAASFNSIYSTGAINSEDTIYAEQQITGNRVMADEQMIFGPDAVIKIITGYNGSTPIYREFPATELSSSDLNGTNYVMVYGVGTPTENASELQAAYDTAKNMAVSSYSYISVSDVAETLYADFTMAGTFKLSEGESVEVGPVGATVFIIQDNIVTVEFDVIEDKNAVIALGSTGEIISNTINKTTVIVAPGEYNFGASTFNVDAESINITSLTGNSDVLLIGQSGSSNPVINASANNIYIKGLNCGIYKFITGDESINSVYENCIGGDYSFGRDGYACVGAFINCVGGDGSFGGGVTISGKYINCKGGAGSFGGGGDVSGVFENCVGGDSSFGGNGGNASAIFRYCTGGSNSFGDGGTLIGELINCKLTSGTFVTPTGSGKIYNSIDGNGNLINTPLPIFADNAAAASLPIGTMYRTATGVQMIRF